MTWLRKRRKQPPPTKTFVDRTGVERWDLAHLHTGEILMSYIVQPGQMLQLDIPPWYGDDAVVTWWVTRTTPGNMKTPPSEVQTFAHSHTIANRGQSFRGGASSGSRQEEDVWGMMTEADWERLGDQ